MIKKLSGIKYFVVTCLAGFSMSGCVSLQAPLAASNFQVRSRHSRVLALQKLTSWYISGAFSVTKEGKSDIANYTWKQRDPQHYLIHISSALNVYAINIVGQPSLVTLYQSKKKPLSAHSPQQLLQQAVGYSLPIANLYYWIRGIRVPGRFKAQYDSFGHLTKLQQQGWTVTFMRYIHFQQLDVPQLISLKSSNIKLRIVIKNGKLYELFTIALAG